jgi:DNA mismatch repair protein MutS
MLNFRKWEEARRNQPTPLFDNLSDEDDMDEPEKVNRKPGSPLKQWAELKKSHPNMLILFRMGDFYELFNDDVAPAAKVLGLTVTKRGETPMAGFPYHMLEKYLHKLLAAGLRVAIAEPTP